MLTTPTSPQLCDNLLRFSYVTAFLQKADQRITETERFAAKYVAPLTHQLLEYSFHTLCRISKHPVYNQDDKS